MKKSIKTQIVEFVKSQNRPVGRFEILRFLFALKGREFDPVENRGYYSHSFYESPCFSYRGYLIKPSKNEPRYLERTDKGYIVVG